MRPSKPQGSWTLLTGHGHVLVEIARRPDARVRDISQAAGVTERTANAIIADLEAAGYITRTREGRRTRYTLHLDAPFRHPAQDGHVVGPFLQLLTDATGRHAGTGDEAPGATAEPPDGRTRTAHGAGRAAAGSWDTSSL